MFLRRIREFSRTLGFRLNLWYSALFVAGALLLFSLVFYLLRSTLDQKDREMVETRLSICESIYETQGLDALREWLSIAHDARQQRPYFMRVNDQAGRLLLLSVPEHWGEQDVRLVSREELVSKKPSWRRIPLDSDIDLSVASTQLSDGATLQIGRRTRSADVLLGELQRIFALALVPIAVIGFAIGAVVARRLTEPLKQLADAVREIINTPATDVRVPTRPTHDELQDFIVLFNRMIEQNHTYLRAMKETLDNVAHDVRTPLTRLRTVAETALHDPDVTNNCAASLEQCVAETDRIQLMIQTLLEVARAEGGVLSPRLERVDIAAVVEDAVELYEDVAEERRLTLRFVPQWGAFATVDAVRMRRVFANLLDNAIHYTPAPGTVSVEVQQVAHSVVVCVRDSGVGISEDDLPRIWDRLFRSDKSRAHAGLGLGLSLVKAIVESNGGTVSVRSKLGHGSEFVVSLPAADG